MMFTKIDEYIAAAKKKKNQIKREYTGLSTVLTFDAAVQQQERKNSFQPNEAS